MHAKEERGGITLFIKNSPVYRYYPVTGIVEILNKGLYKKLLRSDAAMEAASEVVANVSWSQLMRQINK